MKKDESTGAMLVLTAFIIIIFFIVTNFADNIEDAFVSQAYDGIELANDWQYIGIEAVTDVSQVIDSKIIDAEVSSDAATIYYENGVSFYYTTEIEDKDVTVKFTFDGSAEFFNEKMYDIIFYSLSDDLTEECQSATDALLDKGEYRTAHNNASYIATYNENTLSIICTSKTNNEE